MADRHSLAREVIELTGNRPDVSLLSKKSGQVGSHPVHDISIMNGGLGCKVCEVSRRLIMGVRKIHVVTKTVWVY